MEMMMMVMVVMIMMNKHVNCHNCRWCLELHVHIDLKLDVFNEHK